MIKPLIVILVAFIVAAINGIFLIPLLHRLKFGQEIREEGPKWHQTKSGTPTMGGFIFIIAQIVALVIGVFVFGLNNDKDKKFQFEYYDDEGKLLWALGPMGLI